MWKDSFPDRDGALAFLEKMGRTVKKDVQAKIRVDVGQIKLRLDNKDKNERCVDIDTVRVSEIKFLYFDQKIIWGPDRVDS